MSGLNNVDQGESWIEVLVKMLKFKRNVLNRKDTSTFAICTLPLPSKLTDFGPKKNSEAGTLGQRHGY